MALPTLVAHCPDCEQPIELAYTIGTIRRMGTLVRVPVDITDQQWADAMDPHIAASDPSHPPRAELGP